MRDRDIMGNGRDVEGRGDLERGVRGRGDDAVLVWRQWEGHAACGS